MTTENLPELNDEHYLKEYGWTKSRFEVIQRMYFKDLTSDDIAVFGHVCKHIGLDPFLKQIYPVVRNTKQSDGTKKPTMSIQTGIDGYRAIAERTGNYSPGKEPLFKYDKDGRLFSATAYVMKMTNDGKWHEVAATAIISEYRPAFANDFWGSKPHIMISKCAEALAIRKAFPAELSGVYTKEEMDQADKEEKLEQAECEEIKHKDSILSLKQENKHSNAQVDTNSYQNKDDTNMNQQSFFSPEELNTFLTMYSQTDDVYKENFERYMLDKWKTNDFKCIPSSVFHACMNTVTRNIEMNSTGKM